MNFQNFRCQDWRVRRFFRFVLLAFAIALGMANGAMAAVNGPVVFINEFHYNDSNTGAATNANDFVEIAGPAGTDLSAYRVYDYHPDGQVSGSIPLTGIIPNQNNGFGTLSFNYGSPGSAVGAPHGFALVHGSAVVQFISVQGTITGAAGPTGGPASGMTSTDIGVFETSATANNQSLQLQGLNGDDYTDFTWTGPIVNTRNAVNANQSFIALVDTFSTLVVTKTADTNDFVCDADCSLREAITVAEADPGAETITFDIPTSDPGYNVGMDVYTIQLSSGLPALSSTSITGPGSSRLVVTRNAAKAFRILETRGASQIIVSGVTLNNGALTDRFNNGAGLYNTGLLRMDDVAVTGSNASGGSLGGGIYNKGSLLALSITVSGNSATGVGGNSNLATGFDVSAGGGIYNTGILQIVNAVPQSVITGNSSTYFGGAIHNTDAPPSPNTVTVATGLTLTHVSMTNNTSQGGGGLYHKAATSSPANISGCSFSSTTMLKSAFGGGIYLNGGVLNVSFSTIENKILVPDPMNFGTGPGGGGIEIQTGTLNLSSSTVSGNHASGYGGGIENYGTLNVVNCTISGNDADEQGGGMYSAGTAKFANTTVTLNTTFGTGGGLMTDNTIEMGNTIVAGNSDGSGAPDISDDFGFGQFTSDGHNFIGNSDGAFNGGFTDGTNGDQVGDSINGVKDPLLNGLADNGGSTKTHSLQSTSPAIDAGDDALAVDFTPSPLNYDQRGPGYPRFLDGNGDTTATVDIGAYEAPTAGNNPPTANDDTATVTEDSSGNSIDVLANDSSAPDSGETLTIVAKTDGTHGAVAIIGGTSIL